MWSRLVFLLLLLCTCSAFVPPSATSRSLYRTKIVTFAENNKDDDEEMLQTKFGGYTAKQRLREEIESPFRSVRLLFFGVSAGSAFLALYFSATNVLKANMGRVDGPSLDDSLQSCAINVGAAVICSALAYRDYQRGQVNLARIAKGGALAKLQVKPASSLKRTTIKDYRRNARVLIAAGGADYISSLARSLTSDQLSDSNNLPELLEEVDVILVPILLEGDDRVGDTQTCWQATQPQDGDRNFDIARSNNIVAFPTGNTAWYEYLESEIETAKTQGFDVQQKGFTIFVKKNGRILRRATGQPQWSGMIETMEVMDGSRFGMPGDSEKYGGP